MFSIYLLDSSKLFQWDLNRKIKIIGKEDVDEVHFSHVGDEEALVIKPIKENNILIANIPNILLQESKDIFVYLVSKDKTLKETFFTVGRREKPTDYLYTEIDILNYSSLEKRLAELEEKLNNISVEETDPTVPDWAKQPNKPRYTASEVGALSSTETVRQLAQKQDKSNLVTSINASSADSTYPSTRAVYEYVGKEFARLIGSAPDALNTIEELANAFNDNQDVLDALNTSITNKQDKADSVGIKTTQGGEIFNDYTNNIASGIHSHAEGQNNKARGRFSHAEGLNTEVKADAAHTEGEATISYTVGSHAEGKSTQAGGNGTDTGGSYAHAEGVNTIALARGSHAEGENTLAQAQSSHAEGGSCQATGEYSHAEGCNNGNIMTTASGKGSHAEGIGNWAIGKGSHAEGINNSASRDHSHAEGDSTTASGIASHTEGKGTIANSSFQHVQGKFNVEDTENKYAHIVGGGSSNTDRKNIHTLDWEGNAEYAGDVIANGCSGENPISLVETANGLNNKITTPLTAEVGQFLKVKSVDENGKPITWEVSDKPTYTAEEVGALSVDTEIPSIEGLATEEYVETKVAELEGTVEITDGEPTKESTVMTLNPNAEEVQLYTAPEIDAMFGSYATDVANMIGGIE